MDNEEPPYPKGEDRKGSKDGITQARQNDKGKSRDLGMIDRVQESGRLAFTALMADATPFELSESSKLPHSPEGYSATRFQSHGESSSRCTTRFDPSRTIRTERDDAEPIRAFDAFVAEDQAALPGETRTLQHQQRSEEIAEQENLDGVDVTTLLSEPALFDQAGNPEEEVGTCSPKELDQIRKALFGSGSQYPFWETLLDFSPNFLTGLESTSGLARHYGQVDAAAARSLWFQQWNDVFTSYNCEVWGDLEPLVAEAKQEIDRLAAGPLPAGRPPETVAFERLRQILSHVRGSP